MFSNPVPHRILRCVVAFVVLTAAMAWASLAPLHADVLPQTVAVAPCHEHQESAPDAACLALCAIAAPGHFTGEIAIATEIAAAKLLPPALGVVLLPSSRDSRRASAPAVRRSDGLPLYLTTQRLRI